MQSRLIQCTFQLENVLTDVEQGFLINAEMEVENVKEDNLVTLRMIFSELQSTLDLVDYSTTAWLLKHCYVARQRYHQYLDYERKKVAQTEERN